MFFGRGISTKHNDFSSPLVPSQYIQLQGSVAGQDMTDVIEECLELVC